MIIQLKVTTANTKVELCMLYYVYYVILWISKKDIVEIL